MGGFSRARKRAGGRAASERNGGREIKLHVSFVRVRVRIFVCMDRKRTRDREKDVVYRFGCTGVLLLEVVCCRADLCEA